LYKFSENKTAAKVQTQYRSMSFPHLCSSFYEFRDT